VIVPTIASLRPEHVSGVRALLEANGCVWVADTTPYNPNLSLVALDKDDVVLGMVVGWHDQQPWAIIDSLYVLPEYHSYGIGYWLFRAMEAVLISRGAIRIRVHVLFPEHMKMLNRLGFHDRAVCHIMERRYA